jgi:SAM-dependent methyltransferase
VGMDLFEEGLRYARCRTSCPLVQGDIHSPPFGLGVDLIGIFDVLEHLPDDLQALRDLRDMLVDGGALLLTVPANKSLWSYFDDASHHYRRYSLRELENKLTLAGYSIEYASHYMASIFLPVWFGRRLQSLRDRRPATDSDRIHDLASAELRITPLVNGLLTFVLGQEAKVISRRRRLPIGTSLIALARKVTRQAPK